MAKKDQDDVVNPDEDTGYSAPSESGEIVDGLQAKIDALEKSVKLSRMKINDYLMRIMADFVRNEDARYAGFEIHGVAEEGTGESGQAEFEFEPKILDGPGVQISAATEESAQETDEVMLEDCEIEEKEKEGDVKMMESDTNLERVGKEIQELVLEGRKELKKDQDRVDENSMDLIQESNESNEIQQENLKQRREREVKIGIRLSHLLFEFLYLLHKGEQLHKYEWLKALFESENYDGLVTDKMVVLLGVTEVLIREFEKPEGCRRREELKKVLFEEEQIDALMEKFKRRFLGIQNVMSYYSLQSSSVFQKAALGFLDSAIEQCEKDLKEIQLKKEKQKELVSDCGSET